MSAITNALERIQNWLQENCPSKALSSPGLTDDRIEWLTKELPFKLPKEVYDLYRWCDTGIYQVHFFPFLSLFSLKQSLDYYYHMVKYGNELLASEIKEDLVSPYGLIIFGQDKGFYYVFCDKEGKKSPPVWCVFMSEDPVICFTNLTSLMLMIAECYETGAYYVNSEGYLEEDESKSELIFRKYNPGIEKRFDW